MAPLVLEHFLGVSGRHPLATTSAPRSRRSGSSSISFGKAPCCCRVGGIDDVVTHVLLHPRAARPRQRTLSRPMRTLSWVCVAQRTHVNIRDALLHGNLKLWIEAAGSLRRSGKARTDAVPWPRVRRPCSSRLAQARSCERIYLLHERPRTVQRNLALHCRTTKHGETCALLRAINVP